MGHDKTERPRMTVGKRMFGPEQVTTAWQRLRDEGWLNLLVPA